MNALDPFRSVSVAWRLLKKAPLVVLLGGLILMLVSNLQFGGNIRVEPGQDFNEFWRETAPQLLWMVPLYLGTGLISALLAAWLIPGYLRAIEVALRQGKDDLGLMFSAGDRFGPVFLTRLLCFVIMLVMATPLMAAIGALVYFAQDGRMEPEVAVILGILTFLVWSVFAIYVGLGLYFADNAASLENMGPGAALRRSFELAKTRRWSMLLFVMISSLIAFAGVFACCVGLLITAPLGMAMKAEAFLMLTRTDTADWWVSTGQVAVPQDGGWGSAPPPPPTPPPLS